MHTRLLPRLLVLTATLAVTAAHAGLVTVAPADDTFITQYGVLGGANSTHGADTSLFSIYANNGNPGFRSYPLVRFDLSSLAGQIVQGPATFEMFLQGTNFGNEGTRLVSVHEVLTPWAGSTATFGNFGGTLDVQFGTDVTAALDTIPVTYLGTGDRYVSWTIPTAVLQGWIDQPSTNNGLLLFNTATANALDLQFSPMEEANAPRLSFDAIPEPGTALFGLALVGTALIRRRR